MTSEIISFEGLGAKAKPSGEVVVPDGYDGFHWDNFGALIPKEYPDATGYKAALHSGKAVGFNANGQPATLSGDAPFSLKSGYFASAWTSGQSVTITSWRHGHQVGEVDVTLDQKSHFLTFGKTFSKIDAVVFTSGDALGTQLAMDDLKVTFNGSPHLGPAHVGADHEFHPIEASGLLGAEFAPGEAGGLVV